MTQAGLCRCMRTFILRTALWILAFGAVLLVMDPSALNGRSGPGGRITLQDGRFRTECGEIWINGANTPWNQWDDFGGKFNARWWSDEFRRLHVNGINATRVWITCSGETAILIDSTGHVAGATREHWSHLDTLFQIARENRVYVMATLMSFDHFKDENPTFRRWRNWIGCDDHIDSYVENYISPFLGRFKQNPWLWSIDLINEPDWVIENGECGRLSWDRMQEYFARASRAIHENSPVLVTVGTAMPKYVTGGTNCLGNKIGNAVLQAKVPDPDARLDFYQWHYYDWENPHFNNPFSVGPSFHGYDRPVVIGEIGAKLPPGGLEAVYRNGWLGIMPWTSNGVDRVGNLDDWSGQSKAFFNVRAKLVFPCGGGN